MPIEARPKSMEQDNIPVGCLLPVCQPYMFQCPLDVSTVRGRHTYLLGIPTFTPGIPTPRRDLVTEIPTLRRKLVPEIPTLRKDLVPEI